ncbi:MAG: peptidoglycan DD-metalloendopeptidase family protein [Bacteroidetes bacterium]|nr:peptidoglycan DD-metalloendopeptidase family protein [Bacteroidota bacterium]
MKLRKNSINILIMLCLFFSFQIVKGQSNSKTTKKDLENKKKRINDEIDEINSMLNKTKANKKNSIGALVNINLKIEKRQELISTINAEIAILNQNIKQNEGQYNTLKQTLEKLKLDYAKMIIAAQRNQDAYSKLMFLFSSENFNQAYTRLKYMQQYNTYRKKQAQEITTTQLEILAKLDELKAQKHEKNVLLGVEESEKKNLDSEKTEQEEVLTSLQTKEKELKHELEKKKQDAIALQTAIKKLIAEEIKRKAEEAMKEAQAKAAKKALAEKEAKALADKKNKKDKKNNTNTTTNNNTEVVEVKVEKKENLFMPELTPEAEALSDDFENNKGKLPWPVMKGMICESYGEHEHPAIKGFMMMNNGVEICSNNGAQARAVFAGEVTGITVSPTGGKFVIIRHGEYLSVYTNLTEVFVKTGQKITIKQAIGVIGFNDDEGKCAMNFQVWKGQKTLDPAGWLINAR